jgi:hypothetical protein
MEDYRLDERERPERHPTAAKRLTEPPRRPISAGAGNCPAARSTDTGTVVAVQPPREARPHVVRSDDGGLRPPGKSAPGMGRRASLAGSFRFRGGKNRNVNTALPYPSAKFIPPAVKHSPHGPRSPAERWLRNHTYRQRPFNPSHLRLFHRRQVDGAWLGAASAFDDFADYPPAHTTRDFPAAKGVSRRKPFDINSFPASM